MKKQGTRMKMVAILPLMKTSERRLDSNGIHGPCTLHYCLCFPNSFVLGCIGWLEICVWPFDFIALIIGVSYSPGKWLLEFEAGIISRQEAHLPRQNKMLLQSSMHCIELNSYTIPMPLQSQITTTLSLSFLLLLTNRSRRCTTLGLLPCCIGLLSAIPSFSFLLLHPGSSLFYNLTVRRNGLWDHISILGVYPGPQPTRVSPQLS